MKYNKWLSLAVAAALATSMVGCSSESGDDGAIGVAGVDGSNGVDGTDGVDGTAGVDGADGEDGVDTTMIGNPGGFATKLQVSEIAVPVLADEKNVTRASGKVYSLVNDATSTPTIKKLLNTGDVDNGEIFGLLKDENDANITLNDGTKLICNGTSVDSFSGAAGSGLDHVSFIYDQNGTTTNGAGNKTGYMVSQFECGVGAMYMNKFEIDAGTGEVSVIPNTMEFISQKDYHGGWVHCAGQTTPWSTHLGSEEYEPNANDGYADNSYYEENVEYYFGGDATKANPYFWGWIPEVSVEDGVPTYTKHYAMGRAAWELGYVMPDKKTVYMSDDGTNVGFYMFVADVAEDLSAGTLYAAKYVQLSEDGAANGRASLQWVNLGHTTDAAVKTAVDAKPSFDDIMVATEPTDGVCASGTYVNTSTGEECLALDTTTYSEAVISRLETRRYAAMKGATMEFRKEEGITFDPDHGVLFVAMSAIEKGMEDNSSSDGYGNNDVRLAKNKCGGIFALNVTSLTVRDTDGDDINSAYVVGDMNLALYGRETSYDSDSIYTGNSCDVDAISNPDNITYLQGSNILAIGEDTGKHHNNVIWAYDVTTKSLTRMITAAEGSETTSPFWHDGNAGEVFMSTVVQHPDVATDDNGFSSISVYGPITK